MVNFGMIDLEQEQKFNLYQFFILDSLSIQLYVFPSI